ncbi:putative lipopolysaccharide transport periplasmic protein LptA [Neisseria elongata subsp. glycolytica ATCC 29315]|uniref:Putative lipopolysaccharide transport periplasmic protein LptA n=1 Tax=Neisseria elongata subsp. glycolytica ATCC 29315 TaxID=546263 RepID=D4DSE6_NEIEG|nr:putative lipopolysaccharide transport periplasmic protein LptA [Neisseria elongata subsp. glycolytica ATCC 29315]
MRSADGQQTMKASGSPVRFGQTLDGGKGTVNGEANQVEYSSASNVVKLSGNAKVTRGGDKAEGAVITYNTRTEVYTVSGSKAAGGKPGKRVNIVIQPSSTGGKK